MKKFGIISLGCPKNLVDSETFCYIAAKHGYVMSEGFSGLDFILINTCSFIQDAINELNTVLKNVSAYKTKGQIKRIFVSGCIMKRHTQHIQKIFPQVDAWIEIKDYPAFEALIAPTKLQTYLRYPMTDGPYSYLKISDGCNNNCSYCTIPSIRGNLKSEKMEDLLREATFLANTGAKELVVIAQDTSSYGKDIYNKQSLSELLKRLHDIPGFEWIRIMYLHPGHIDTELVQTIASLPKVVHAFEMPLQHCNDKILEAMNRHYTKNDIINVYNMFKDSMPDAEFRTTFITGFPGESRAQFDELMQFIKDYKFLRMGAFAYSLEGGTPAFSMPDKVNETTANKRKDELLSLHRTLSEDYLAEYVGKEVEVLVEEAYPEEDDFYGRAWFDAPEIDGVVNFTGKDIDFGDIVKVHIDDVIDIDLFGSLSKLVHKYDFELAED
jgi:ribosomal protein S12 methylthiotransferase